MSTHTFITVGNDDVNNFFIFDIYIYLAVAFMSGINLPQMLNEMEIMIMAFFSRNDH